MFTGIRLETLLLVLCCQATQMGVPGLFLSLLLFLTARPASNRYAIDIALHNLVPPLLLLACPYLSASAITTVEGVVHIKQG